MGERIEKPKFKKKGEYYKSATLQLFHNYNAFTQSIDYKERSINGII